MIYQGRNISVAVSIFLIFNPCLSQTTGGSTPRFSRTSTRYCSPIHTTRFRDVLWTVARKAGYSPESGNFITNQAIPIGEYINDWVGRLYAQEDWPEWTKIVKAVPDPTTHIVPYFDTIATNGAGSDIRYTIGRVITVYLVDPETNRAPITTRFALQEDGIHCGYEHGTFVWIKYIEPPPTFTAVVWQAQATYSKNDVVYWPNTGECYTSKVNNNIGNDPTTNTEPPPDLTMEDTQDLVPADTGVAAQSQIIDCYVTAADGSVEHAITDPMPISDQFTMGIYDLNDNVLGAHTQTQSGTSTIEDLLDALKVQFDGDAISGFTFTVVAPNKFRIASTTTEFVVKFWNYLVGSAEPFFPLRFIQVQPLSAGSASTDTVPRQVKLTIGDNAFFPGATYSIDITDIDGHVHTVDYDSNVYDNRVQILNGLMQAIGASADPSIFNIGTSLDTSEPSGTLSMFRALGVYGRVRPPDSQYWKLVPFPEALFLPVVRGASADLMGEWGQTDKMSVEEAKVPGETEVSRGDFETTTLGSLTTQQKPYSRYKL